MVTSLSISRRPALPALTGIRFLAAFAVVAFHFAEPANAYIRAANRHGFIGVSLFFILSGFILAYTYCSEPGAMKGTSAMFWAARFARIYPMYLVAALVMAPIIVAWSKSGHVWWSGLAAVTLSQAWLGTALCEWNPPGWSLSAEFFFYLLFPLSLRFISRLGSGALSGLLLLLWAASLTAPAIYVITGAVDRDFWMFNPLVRLPEFLIGVTAGVLWMQRDRGSLQLPAYMAEFSFVVLLAVLCIPMNEAYIMNGACAPLITLIILGLAAGQGPMARLLGTKIFVALGGASFSLYILHWPVWHGVKAVLDRMHLSLDANVMFWLITLAVLLPASYVAFHFIEEPINKYLRTRFSARLARTPPTAQSGPSFVSTANVAKD
jgi:peptidoglycan/LPS O-acetylase OafA/YrhL